MKFSVSILFGCLVCQIGAQVVTVIHPSEKFVPATTVVWSPLFQATWDAMNTEMGGKPEKVEPPNELVSRLDTFQWDSTEVMPDSGWKVWSGKATAVFLKQVNAEAAKMTGEPKGPFELGAEAPGSIASFGLLNREVEFRKEFHEAKRRPLTFRANNNLEQVRFFGSRGKLSGEYLNSVEVLLYANGSHALDISCKGSDRVVLYLPREPLEFDAACEVIRTLRKKFKSREGTDPSQGLPFLGGGDDVRIPYVSLNSEVDLTDKVVGGRFYGKAGDPWNVSRAKQKTEFELFEKGARVRVETSTHLDPFAGALVSPKPRKFIYDRPFFVFLWREGVEWPYFGVWVGDSSALRKFQPEQ